MDRMTDSRFGPALSNPLSTLAPSRPYPRQEMKSKGEIDRNSEASETGYLVTAAVALFIPHRSGGFY
jgi:hypothetical protein